MRARIGCGLLGCGAALLLLAGCGNYTITFEVADVINAPTTDTSREQLDVDILCLTKEQTEKLPEITEGALRSDEWFRLRDEDDPKIAVIKADQIYALRRGAEKELRDTLLGPSLLSFIDREDKERTVTVKVRHPDAGNSKSAIVIYGRFRGPSGLAKTAPVVIQPPPGFMKDKQIIIKVGKTGMECTNCP